MKENKQAVLNSDFFLSAMGKSIYELVSERGKEVLNVCFSFLLRGVNGAFVHTIIPTTIPEARKTQHTSFYRTQKEIYCITSKDKCNFTDRYAS